MNYIYKVTNLINNKIYIGLTRKTIQQRWSEHVCSAYNNQHLKDYNFLLHKAIRKYGKENFVIEEIEKVPDEQDLQKKEQYWISFYNCCILEEDGNGYNMTYGGEGSPYINKQKVFDLWDQGFGSMKIASELGHHKKSIKDILLTYSNYDKVLDRSRNSGVTVYCYNSNGELINSFPSIAYAAKIIGIDGSIISKCCNKVKKSGGGYFWSYSDKDIFQPTQLKTWSKHPVIQLTLENKIVAEYDSLSAAGRALNKKTTKYIKECCDKKRENMYGFKWRYKE